MACVLAGCNSPEEDADNGFAELKLLIDQYANNTIGRNNINALAIAVYKDGLTYKNYYGSIDGTDGNTPTDSTLYEIASISKIFVGSLVARAVTEQKLALEDDIREYLPGEYNNLAYEGKPIQIKDIVTHTIGFQMPPRLRDTYEKIFTGYYEDHNIDYQMRDLLNELQSVEMDNRPGTTYDYNNFGPELAAYVLEQVYEQPYEQLLNSFLHELGIDNIHIQEFEQYQKYLAQGYNEEGEVATAVRNPLLGGAGGLIAGLPDLSRYMEFLLESDAAFIKESTRDLYKDDENRLGYFWNLGTAKREGFYFTKTGSANGTESVMLICPDTNYGMVMVMNNQSEAALDDWVSLYNRIERDLIEYPKINAWSKVEQEFFDSPEKALPVYDQLKRDSAKYFTSAEYLNRVAYGYIYNDDIEKAIKVFEFAISEYPDDANLYDSLGELYFFTEEYDKSKVYYERSLARNPNNSNAKEYLQKIAEVLKI